MLCGTATHRIVPYRAGTDVKEPLCNINIDKSSHSHLGRAASPPLTQRMDSPASCATSCAMPIADKSNHSAAGTLHPHRSATCFLHVTLCCRLPTPSPKKLPLPIGATHLLGKKSSLDPPNHHPKQHNWRTYTELLLL